MPAIILIILKIIGITLLAVLGLVLLIIALVLFVPIRYMVTADKENGEKKPIEADAAVNWLFHIVSVIYKYDEAKTGLQIRICGIRLKSAEEKELAKEAKRKNHIYKDEKKETVKQKKNRKRSEAENKDKDEYTVYEYDPASDELKETDLKEEAPAMPEEEVSIPMEDHPAAEDINDNSESVERAPLSDKIMDRLHLIADRIRSIGYKIKTAGQNIKDTVEKAGYYYNALTNDAGNREAMALLYNKLIRLLKSIRPRKVSGHMDYGSDDPAKTGEFLMRAGMLYPLYGRSIIVNPDFENKVLAFDIMLKGRIYLCVVAKILVQLYFNKKVKRFIHIMKKENA